MKTVNTIVKILSALAAVAGAVYIIATYGEQITAWAKKTLASLPQCPRCKGDAADDETPAEETDVEAAPAEEEPAAVEIPVEAPVAPAQEPVVAPHEPVAEEADFAE